jgi:hypothetical protein
MPLHHFQANCRLLLALPACGFAGMPAPNAIHATQFVSAGAYGTNPVPWMDIFLPLTLRYP